MPSATAFKAAFHLEQGAALGGYIIEDSTVGHEVVKQYERYEFPIALTLHASASATAAALPGHSGPSLVASLQKALPSVLRVYSEYGSPYDCTIYGIKVKPSASSSGSSSSSSGAGAYVTVTAKGVAVRDHEAPTLKELSAGANAKAEADVSPSDRARLEKTHRLVASHFATGTCEGCDVAIAPGATIARPKSLDIKGAKGGVDAHRVRRGAGPALPQGRRKKGQRRRQRSRQEQAPRPLRLRGKGQRSVVVVPSRPGGGV